MARRRLDRALPFCAGGLSVLLAVAGCTSRTPRLVEQVGPVRQVYTSDSFWNTPVPPKASAHPDSERLVRTLGERLTSDPTQYTMAVYETDPLARPVRLRVRGVYSDVTHNGTRMDRQQDVTLSVPLPVDATPATGSDAHLVLHDPDTGDEWGFWRAVQRSPSEWEATNGYHYDTDWSGVPPPGFGSRGSGLPYLAGLIRRDEVQRGLIDHVVAFAYPTPSCASVWPATKSDGRGDPDRDLPEGSRLQLDPLLDRDDFQRWGLDRTGRIIARALQEYGMVVVDVSGRPKIYLEAQHTALWPAGVDASTVSGIPLSAFRVLTPSHPVSTASCGR